MIHAPFNSFKYAVLTLSPGEGNLSGALYIYSNFVYIYCLDQPFADKIPLAKGYLF